MHHTVCIARHVLCISEVFVVFRWAKRRLPYRQIQLLLPCHDRWLENEVSPGLRRADRRRLSLRVRPGVSVSFEFWEPSVYPCLHTVSVLSFLLTSVSEGYISLYSNPFPALLRPSARHNLSKSNPPFLCPYSCVLSRRKAHLRGSQKSAGTRRQTLALFRTSGWRKPSWLFLWIYRMKPHLTTRRYQCRRPHYIWIVTLIGEYLCLIDQRSTCQVQGFWGPSTYCVHPV